MITTKRYTVEQLKWNAKDNIYRSTGELWWEGEPLTFDTYREFLMFLDSLTALEKHTLGIIRVTNHVTGDDLNVAYGAFGEISTVSLWAMEHEQ